MLFQQIGSLARLEVAPDIDELRRRELASWGGSVSAIWVSDPGDIKVAHHVSSLRRARGELCIPTFRREVLDDVLATGRAGNISAVGPLPSDIRHPDVRVLGDGQELLRAELGVSRQRAGDGPLSGTVYYTLAVSTGLEFPDTDATDCTPAEEGLECDELDEDCENEEESFYDSTLVGSELCDGRSNCIPLDIYSGGPPSESVFDLNPPTATGKKGWQVNVESAFRSSIAGYVASFNDQDPDHQITKLAIVSHPLDIPYRRWLFPYTYCETNGVPNCIQLDCGMDAAWTDNTIPRDGDCDFVLYPDGSYDGATGAADFYFADIATDATPYPIAELAFSRVGGQRISDALALVCTDRHLLGVGCDSCTQQDDCPTAGNGAIAVSTYSTHYTIFGSLFDDFYSEPTVRQCEPPNDYTDNPFCPSNLYPCEEVTGSGEYYSIAEDLVEWLLESAENYEVVMVYGHQDGSPEDFDAEGCVIDGAIAPQMLDRQRVQFLKNHGGCPPDCTRFPQAPQYTTDFFEDLQTAGTPAELGPNLWLMAASNVGTYNYINRAVREQCLGPDSSHLSTLLTGGASGLMTHISYNFDAAYSGGEPPDAHIARTLRALTEGKTLGEATRDIANMKSAGYPNPALVFAFDSVSYGDPDLTLHLPPSEPGTDEDNIVVMAAPGPDGSVYNQPSLLGFNEDGAHLGIPSITAYYGNTYGANIAVGNLDSTADDEILSGPGPGAGYLAQVRGFQWDGTPLSKVNFFAYSTTDYGVNVGVVDYDNDGMDEIVTAPGRGNSSPFAPLVRLWNYDGGSISTSPPASFYAFGEGYYGANVAGGNILPAAGIGEEVLVARGPDSAARTYRAKVFRFANLMGTIVPVETNIKGAGPSSFPSSGGSSTYGATVAVGQLESTDLTGADDIVLGSGPSGSNPGSIVAYKGGTDAALSSLTVLYDVADVFQDDGADGGATVATSNVDGDAAREIIVGRGECTLAQSQFRIGRVVALDAPCASPPCQSPSLVMDFDATPAGGSTALKGVRVAGIWIPDVPLPSLETSGLANGIASLRIALPVEALAPVAIMVKAAVEEGFAGPLSRWRMRAALFSLREMLAKRNLEGARSKLAETRALADREVPHRFLRGALEESLNAVDDAIVREIENAAPVAAISGPTQVEPGRWTFSALDSTDPDVRGLSRDDIQRYEWRMDGDLVSGERTALATLPLAAGNHDIEVTAIDTFGASSRASMNVEVAARSSSAKGAR